MSSSWFEPLHPQHECVRGLVGTEPTYPVYDAQGIYLCRVCDDCVAEKLGRYRPEILSGYTQNDVNEEIEPG